MACRYLNDGLKEGRKVKEGRKKGKGGKEGKRKEGK
jgi:hypothetical protein